MQKSAEGNEIVFVPSIFAGMTIKYIKRFYSRLRLEWRANYTRLAIFMED